MQGKSTTSTDDRARQFAELLTGSQRRLYAYINTLLGGSSAVADVLQDTNVDLWAKSDEFDSTRPFLPWAYRFAYYRVMAHRKTLSRSRLVFDDRVVDRLAARYEQTDADPDRRLKALNHCIGKLPEHHQDLIEQRYTHKRAVRAIAERLAEPANRVAVRLFGIRSALLSCIKTRLAAEGAT